MNQTLARLVNATSGSYSRSAVNRKLKREGGVGGGGVGRHYYIMLQRNTEPEKVRSTRIDQLFYFSLNGLFVLQVTSCDR